MGTVSALAEEPEPGRLTLFGHHYSVIAGANVWVPEQAETRSRYEDHDVAPSVRLFRFDNPAGLHFDSGFGAHRIGTTGHRADFVAGGVGARLILGPPTWPVVPFASGLGGPAVAWLTGRDPEVVPFATGEGGLVIGHTVVLAGAYSWLRKVDGVDLSGFSFTAMVKVF